MRPTPETLVLSDDPIVAGKAPLRAVILAAGQGKRLLPLTESRPKCLVELSGRSLLAWQLLRLQRAGVAEVVVVTGFGAEAVEAEIAGLGLDPMRVRTLYNPFYAVSDNIASCWIAREAFEGPVLLLNGDTLFEQEIVQRLIGAPEAAVTVTIDRKSDYDADDMKVLTDGDVLCAIGKTITAYDAESIGFLRFSAEGAQLFMEAVDATLRKVGGLGRWYLSVIDELARTRGCVRVVSIQGLEWAEMDFPHDLAANIELTARWARTGEVIGAG